jgi:hypothetical protein
MDWQEDCFIKDEFIAKKMKGVQYEEDGLFIKSKKERRHLSQ